MSDLATRPGPPAAVADGGVTPSRWVPTPLSFARLMLGLALFGAGEALLLWSALGNTPWTVLAEGVEVQTALSVGAATVLISFVVLALWIPLRQRPGLGTLANAVVVGLTIDVVLAALGSEPELGARMAAMLGGVAVVALGSGLYLGAQLGPGPRDGLMTGVHRRTGWPIAPVRVGIELGAVAAGFALGGTVGLGTIVFAVGIGPAVALALRLLYSGDPRAL